VKSSSTEHYQGNWCLISHLQPALRISYTSQKRRKQPEMMRAPAETAMQAYSSARCCCSDVASFPGCYEAARCDSDDDEGRRAQLQLQHLLYPHACVLASWRQNRLQQQIQLPAEVSFPPRSAVKFCGRARRLGRHPSRDSLLECACEGCCPCLQHHREEGWPVADAVHQQLPELAHHRSAMWDSEMTLHLRLSVHLPHHR
jgi:hypothetical protein